MRICFALLAITLIGLPPTAADETVTFQMTLDLGKDRGQSFGSIFEARNASGRVVAGAGFEDVYNTRLRSDRHTLQFFVRPASDDDRFTVSRLPHPDLDCGIYLFDLDEETYAGLWSAVRTVEAALKQATGRAVIQTLLADAGYDSEAAHEFARGECGTRTIIPAKRGRVTTKPLKGYWRNQMKTRFNKKKYGQRWQVETVNSMIKRTLDSALRARTYWSQSREITLRVLTHNIMIIKHR